MFKHKRFLAALLTTALALTAGLVPAAAEFEDEQWPKPNHDQFGSHVVTVEETLPGNFTYSQLTAFRGADTILCKSVDDANCKGAKDFQYVAMLPACDALIVIDCIEALNAIDSAGTVSAATFDRYIYPDHPNMFIGDGARVIKSPASPSVWKMPGAAHNSGEEYAMAVSLSGGVGSNQGGPAQLQMNLYAVTYKAGSGEKRPSDEYANYGMCNQAKDATSGRSFLKCAIGGQELGRYRCALQVQETSGCLMQHGFPSEHEFKISLRLSQEPTGWFHGRMKNPTVQVDKLSGSAVRLSVKASPTKVPILYQHEIYSEMPAELKAYWDTCLPAGTCSSGTRKGGTNPNTEPDGNKRNAIHDPLAYTAQAIKAVNYFGKFAGDKSAASPSLWSARSLSSGEMNGANRCFSDGSGVKGILTTNATAYSEGPPKFTNGSLNYQVAGLHFAADGETLNEGVYDMVMKSTVARCLYGFSKAPISARISVTSATGEKKVATTVVSEKNGWLKLAAYGFTFSSPTISVKLSQGKAAPVAKKTTITCVNVKYKKLTKKVTAASPKCPSGYKKK